MHDIPMARLVIYGAGGFGREVLTAARSREAVLADDHAGDAIRPADIHADDDVVIAIGDGAVRERIARMKNRYGAVIAPTAILGGNVVLGEGAIICDFAMITAQATIGRHFHLNIYSYVAHDCVVGDFVTFGPRVCCNGNVRIGDGAYIGAGAILKNGTSERPLTIGAGAVVGCGAVVTRDVAPGSVVVGNPARAMTASSVIPVADHGRETPMLLASSLVSVE